MQYLSQSIVFGKSDIGQSLVEAGDRATIHFIVFSVPTVHLDDGGFVAVGVGVRGRATESLGPVCGETFRVLRVEAVAERMGDDLVGHDPMMPCVGETAKTVATTCCLEDSLHSSMIASLVLLCNRVNNMRLT
jgi:hypothetical protein